MTAGADASAGKLIKTPNQVATSMKHGDFKKAHGKPKGKKGFS